MNLDFITTNPAIEEFNRANEVARKEQTADLQNKAATFKLQQEQAEAPTRLRQLTAATNLAETQAKTAQATAPYAVDQARLNIQKEKAELAGMSRAESAWRLDQQSKVYQALDANNPELAKSIAASIGKPLSDETIQNRNFLNATKAIHEEALRRFPDQPRTALAWQTGAIGDLLEQHARNQPINPTTAPYTIQVPGVPEPHDIVKPFNIAPGSTAINPSTGEVIYHNDTSRAGSRYGVIGRDEDGQPIYGWINPQNQTTNPAYNADRQPSVPSTFSPSGALPVSPSGALPANETPIGAAAVPGAAMGGQTATTEPGVTDTNTAPGAPVNIPQPRPGEQIGPLPRRADELRAQAIANYQMPPPGQFVQRTAAGRQLMGRVMEINPGYSTGEFGMHNRAMTAFGTGKQGDIVRSLNVAIDHLGTLEELSKALNNRNTQMINRIANRIAAETGQSAPVNFAGAKSIVGDEVTKAVIGSGGGVSDRDKMQAIIDQANSPEQLAGAIATLKKLMAGQLNGLRGQYERTTGKTNFDALLSDATRRELMSGSAPAPSAQGKPAQVMQNGHIYQLQPDGSYQ